MDDDKTYEGYQLGEGKKCRKGSWGLKNFLLWDRDELGGAKSSEECVMSEEESKERYMSIALNVDLPDSFLAG